MDDVDLSALGLDEWGLECTLLDATTAIDRFPLSPQLPLNKERRRVLPTMMDKRNFPNTRNIPFLHSTFTSFFTPQRRTYKTSIPPL